MYIYYSYTQSVVFVGTGWFTTDPFEITELFGGQWKTSDVQAGDVLIFKMRCIYFYSLDSISDLYQKSNQTGEKRFDIIRETLQHVGGALAHQTFLAACGCKS